MSYLYSDLQGITRLINEFTVEKLSRILGPYVQQCANPWLSKQPGARSASVDVDYSPDGYLRELRSPDDLLHSISYVAGNLLAETISLGGRHRGEPVYFFDQRVVAERPICELFNIHTSNNGLSIAMYGARDMCSTVIKLRFQVNFLFQERYERPRWDPYLKSKVPSFLSYDPSTP